VVQRWATGWMIAGSSTERGRAFFSSPPRPDRLWGPPSLLSNVYQEIFSWGQSGRGREADHSPPSSAEAKSAWSYTSTPSICLHGAISINIHHIEKYLK
jgi:hypothetical protein